MVSLSYVYVCVEGRLARTSWQIRPWPKTVILLINKKSVNQSVPERHWGLFALYPIMAVRLSSSKEGSANSVAEMWAAFHSNILLLLVF